MFAFGSVPFSSVFFYFNYKKIKKTHTLSCVDLEQKIQRHKNQISKRSTALQSYDLSKHNISEALFVQPEIII
ncbi:MAG: hypothetical protein ACI849_001040 [Patiriisocius sp.]|jgi:hypothetical protein